MKQILLTLALAAFTVAVQAGEAKTSKTANAEKSSCCQAKGTEQTKADCGDACCSMKTTMKAKSNSTRQALLSPKASGEVTKKL